jgi:hypothetical protein
MSTIHDEWETKNQSRRYPLDELGDVLPFDLLADMTLAVPTGQSVDDVYVSKLLVKNGKCSISLKRADGKIVATAYGASDDCADFSSNYDYAGAVSFGVIDSDRTESISFNSTTGKLAAGVAYQVPASFYINSVTNGVKTLLGDVLIKGGGDFTVEVGTITYMSELRSSIILKPSEKLTAKLLTSCNLPPEEVMAKLFGTQGLLTINGVKVASNGNIDIELTGLGVTNINGDHVVNLTVERGTMCGIAPILSKTYYPEALVCNSSSSG